MNQHPIPGLAVMGPNAELVPGIRRPLGDETVLLRIRDLDEGIGRGIGSVLHFA